MILMTCLSKARTTFSKIAILIIGLSVLGSSATYAQDDPYIQDETDSLWMLSWHSEWDDALFDWEVIYETLDEEEQGEIEATWAHNNDFSQWDYSVGDYDGTIWRKWPDRDDQWELRSDGNTTPITPKWLNYYYTQVAQ